MGIHARIQRGYISIDTATWLARRTGGPVPSLTRDLHAWGRDRHGSDPATWRWADLALLWRREQGLVAVERVEGCAQDDEVDPTLISLIGTRLDTDLWVLRLWSEEADRVAVVQINEELPIVYADRADLRTWYDADTVEIRCPGGHRWTWRTGRELIDARGRYTTLTAVFGHSLDAPFSPCPDCRAVQRGPGTVGCGCDRASWIVCPICERRCDVDLPAIR